MSAESAIGPFSGRCPAECCGWQPKQIESPGPLSVTELISLGLLRIRGCFMTGKAALFYNISLCVELILMGIFLLKSTFWMTGQTKIYLILVWRAA